MDVQNKLQIFWIFVHQKNGLKDVFDGHWQVLKKINRVIRFFINALNNIWYVVWFKEAFVKAQYHIQLDFDS